MNAILAIPLPVRLIVLFLVGACLGGQVNRGIYRLAYRRRNIGPWSPPLPAAPPRHWWDRLPILGWWGLARESQLHGRGFWVRPVLIELSLGLGLAALYAYELAGGLYPVELVQPDLAVVHAQFLAHALLIGLMTVATFIDFDEQTIPDEVTLPGAVLALGLAAWLPSSLLPGVVQVDFVPDVYHLVVTSSTRQSGWLDGLGGPQSWPPRLNTLEGLGLGLLCLVAWYLAVIPKLWTTRRGLRKALVYVVASIVRYRSWLFPTLLFLPAVALVVGAFQAGGARWQAVFSVLVGMVFGGGLTWLVRILATSALQAEAMGFGDVTLMAMIGGFLGWQSSLLVFFMAPFAAIFIAVTQFLLTRRRDIAFGPYLCLAAVVLIVGWDSWWRNWVEDVFRMGWFIPAITGCGLAVMGGMLWLWRLIREAIVG